MSIQATLAIYLASTARRTVHQIARVVRALLIGVKRASTGKARRRVQPVHPVMPGPTGAGGQGRQKGRVLHVPTTSRPIPSTRLTAGSPARAAGRATAGTTKTDRRVSHARL